MSETFAFIILLVWAAWEFNDSLATVLKSNASNGGVASARSRKYSIGWSSDLRLTRDRAHWGGHVEL